MMDAGPPPGELVDIGGYRLHINTEGSGPPSVVFEAAMWETGLTWSLVQPEVATFAEACVYDRAGLGWSEPSPKPRTAGVMVEELRAGLAAAGISPPHVVVAHSSSQEELARLSSRGRVVVAEGAGHMIHHERPDLVADAIREVATPLRERG